MKIYAINGGPRKGWNTETMLRHFLDGAHSADAAVETELVHLYDLDYKGCTSCYACQRDDDATYGRCQVRDDIHQLLWDISLSGGAAFGSPIYLGDLTGQLRSFIERLVYQHISFQADSKRSHAPKMLRTAMLYTMNVKQPVFEQAGYEHILGHAEQSIAGVFGHQPLRICAYDTCQYKDYSQYRASRWDPTEKAESRRTRFPLDCKAAYDAGRQMALAALAEKQEQLP